MPKGIWLQQRTLLTYNDSSSPGVQQEKGTHQECTGQDHADGQEEPMAETNILFPEEEWVAIRIIWHSQAGIIVANGSHFLDRFHKVWRLSKAIEVERKLGILDWLSCADYKTNKHGDQ